MGDAGPHDAVDRRRNPVQRSVFVILIMPAVVLGSVWLGQLTVSDRPPARPALLVLRACNYSSASGLNSDSGNQSNSGGSSSYGFTTNSSVEKSDSSDTSATFSGATALNWDIVVPELPAGSNNTTFPDIAARVLELERQGKGHKLISMSLYGADARYTMGALENALLAKRMWNGWTLRMYVGDGVPADVLMALKALGVDIVHVMSNQKGIAGMYWRFFAVEDRTATRVIIRDCDARLTRRDYTATQEWVKSGRFFHALHDHKNHRQIIMGGMWGAVGGFINPAVFKPWRKQDGTESPTYMKGSDQVWLAKNIWPHVRLYSLVHASWRCTFFKAAEWRPFPTQREGPSDFVGNVYRPPHFAGFSIHSECEVECRGNVNWTMC